MARPNKVGIDYFPLDVDFFTDDKVMLIEGEFGVKGGYIAIRLLCKIYKEGYYYRWGNDEALLFTRAIGLEGITKGLIDEVITTLVKRSFFDKELFAKYNILTSKGIQRRYFEATKRYKEVSAIKEYLLIDTETLENVTFTSVNANTNPEKKRKKEVNKEEEIQGYERFSFLFLEKDFRESFIRWLDYKKERKEKYKTQTSLETCYQQLKEKASNDPLTAMKIVEQSIGNNWAGLFELKNNNQKNNSYDKTDKHPTTTTRISDKEYTVF